jgi:hypothetical protein
MVSFGSRAAVVTCALVLSACSLAVDGLSADGGSTTAPPSSTASQNPPDASEPGTDMDASQTPPHDGGGTPVDDAGGAPPHDGGPTTPDDGQTPPPPFDASACNNMPGCFVVPDGWSVVAFSTAPAMPCPPNFGTASATNVFEGPDASGACSCGACTVTTQPSCSVGAVQGFYDTKRTAAEGTCSSPDVMPVLSNSPAGSCLTDIYDGGYGTFDVEYDGPTAASGGACTSPGVLAAHPVMFASEGSSCVANDMSLVGCTGNVCSPMAPPGFQVCIAVAGAQACPPGPLGTQHLVGTGATVTCGDCGCTVSGTCGGDATITLFGDTSCTRGGNTMPANTCTAISGNPTYQAYEYDGGAPDKVSCQVGASNATPDVTLANEQTICCAQ